MAGKPTVAWALRLKVLVRRNDVLWMSCAHAVALRENNLCGIEASGK
jgi:hypothetical protein